MVDVVGQLGRGEVDAGRADRLLLHGLEGGELGIELFFEEEETGEVQGQAQGGHDCDRIHDLPALYGLLGVLPPLEVSLADQQILRIHLKILAYHLDRILHLLCVFLVHVGLAVRNVEQTGERKA